MVVLVHGAMDRASSFGRVGRRLPDVPLVRYDRRGYGRSQPGTAVGLAGHADDLLEVIGGRDCVVFGHSVGGTVALAAAARPASSIRALAVYESPVPSVADVTPFPYEPAEAPADVAERFMRTMVGERIWNRLPSATRADRRAEGPALLADLVAVREEAPHLDVAAVTVPVLVGVGAMSGDGYRRRADALVAALPDGHLWVTDRAGHAVHLQDPAATADLVLELRLLAGARENPA